MGKILTCFIGWGFVLLFVSMIVTNTFGIDFVVMGSLCGSFIGMAWLR